MYSKVLSNPGAGSCCALSPDLNIIVS